MRLEHLMREIYDKPWALQAGVHRRIHELVQKKLAMTKPEFQARERTVEICGDKITLDSMVIEDGIAHIPFGGVLVKGAGDWEKWAGALSHEDVTTDIKEALADNEVEAIMFSVDSPGGTCAGSFELAELVAEANDKKPCMAWVEGMCCSAAFLSMSGCAMIYGSRTSEVGAIECYLPWVDASARYKAMGYAVDVIKPDQSTHAAAGYPGTSLTEEQRDYMKSQVTDLLGEYVSHLQEVRPQVPEEAMDGRTFIGARALEVGMLDAITTEEQALEDLRTWVEMHR